MDNFVTFSEHILLQIKKYGHACLILCIRVRSCTCTDIGHSTRGLAQDCWSAYIFFNQIHYFMVKITTFFHFQYFMVKITTFFAEWWSGPTSADWQGQNTAG
jgi:hypothetical protein